MDHPIARGLRMALIGLVMGPVCALAVFAVHSKLTLDMDRELPARLVSGLYYSETVGEETFVWTSDRVRMNLPGFYRRIPWRCVVRFRGGRPSGVAQPTFEI